MCQTTNLEVVPKHALPNAASIDSWCYSINSTSMELIWNLLTFNTLENKKLGAYVQIAISKDDVSQVSQNLT